MEIPTLKGRYPATLNSKLHDGRAFGYRTKPGIFSPHPPTHQPHDPLTP